jgi:hypothetical protein
VELLTRDGVGSAADIGFQRRQRLSESFPWTTSYMWVRRYGIRGVHRAQAAAGRNAVTTAALPGIFLDNFKAGCDDMLRTWVRRALWLHGLGEAHGALTGDHDSVATQQSRGARELSVRMGTGVERGDVRASSWRAEGRWATSRPMRRRPLLASMR